MLNLITFIVLFEIKIDINFFIKNANLYKTLRQLNTDKLPISNKYPNSL